MVFAGEDLRGRSDAQYQLAGTTKSPKASCWKDLGAEFVELKKRRAQSRPYHASQHVHEKPDGNHFLPQWPNMASSLVAELRMMKRR